MVDGIDVSFWQDDNSTPDQIKWKKAKSAGAAFAFIRASQGTFADSDFTYNWREAKKAGLLRGAYHFFDYRFSASQQANFFTGLLSSDWGELPPVIDLERMPGWSIPVAATLLASVKVFVDEVERLANRKVIFYSNPDLILNYLRPVPAWLLDHPLWIAHYGAQSPLIGEWKQWTFWQYTNQGDGPTYGAESKSIDLNHFNGTLKELRAFAGVAEPAPTLSLEEMVARLWAAHPELHDQ